MHPIDVPQTALTTTAAAGSELQLITNARDFCALASEWERLRTETAATSVFNTWMWLFAWWEQHGRPRTLKILVARRAGLAVGIAPLYVQRSWGLRVLRLLGTEANSNPYNIAPLFEPGSETSAARALAQAILATHGYDVVELADTDAAIPLGMALAHAARAGGRRYEISRARRLVHLPLPPSWNAYLRSLSSEQRARLRHRRQALLGAHATRFFVWHTGVDAMLNAFAMLHRSGTTKQAPPQRATLAEALQEGRLRLYCLQVDGRIAALACAVRLRERMVVMQTGLDARYAAWHPVSVLLPYAIEHAIDEGAKGFDFLPGQALAGEEIAPGNEQISVTVFRSAIAAAAFRARKALAAQSTPA
jgi:CelD/BcsL family acetyltransferase involved in cellulose biosynthesis